MLFVCMQSALFDYVCVYTIFKWGYSSFQLIFSTDSLYFFINKLFSHIWLILACFHEIILTNQVTQFKSHSLTISESLTIFQLLRSEFYRSAKSDFIFLAKKYVSLIKPNLPKDDLTYPSPTPNNQGAIHTTYCSQGRRNLPKAEWASVNVRGTICPLCLRQG